MREGRKNRKEKEGREEKKNPKPYHLPPRRRTQLRGLGKRFSFDVGASARRAFRPFSTPVFYGLGSMALPGEVETSNASSYTYLSAKHAGQMERKKEEKREEMGVGRGKR